MATRPDLSDPGPFGTALKAARGSRRISQLALALEAGVSARHLSFLESGRAMPSREMVLTLAEALALPLAQRNHLLNAAGFASAYPASPLASDAIAPFRTILQTMMHNHAPFPALLCDRHWNVLEASPSAAAMLTPLLEGWHAPPNVFRLTACHPRAVEFIANLPEVLHESLERLALEQSLAGDDPVLADLIAVTRAAAARHPYRPAARTRSPVLPVSYRGPAGVLSFLSVVAQCGTSEDVTVRDLRLELLFPADEATRAAFTA
ncbi:helix-turn-helix transcriptional regulator [Sandarakinorhabdus rubra]|uniref:helix-turn-helix transcriptional regulator n=1 Tax=Sandarakinorhabdus rubra TaxID=2672568 RepID=UPI0013D8E58E|nr:helix-turn-helix transcriptional regulator [Sandarakinorhabdus rubra]